MALLRLSVVLSFLRETMAVSLMTLSKPLSSLESIGSHWLS